MKGFIYSILALFFVGAILFTTITWHKLETGYEKRQLEKNRILAINDLVRSIQEDLRRATNIACYHSLTALISYVAKTGNFSANASQDLVRLMVNGSIGGKNVSVMEGATLTYWIEKLNSIAKFQGVNAKISVSKIRVYQDNPWRITVNLSLNLTVRDAILKTCLFNQTENLSIEVPIYGLEDPLYLYYSKGAITNKIERSWYENNFTKKEFEGSYNSSIPAVSPGDWYFGNVSCSGNNLTLVTSSSNITLINVSSCNPKNGITLLILANKTFEAWNIENLKNHLYRDYNVTYFGGSYYIHSKNAPSLLQRIEGNLNASECCGIESLVNIDFIKSVKNGKFVRESALEDYLYWRNESFNFKVKGMPTWFGLKNNNYNISSSLKYT